MRGAKGGYMKKILKNNSVIITALCIMIAIVWYLNNTGVSKETLEAGANLSNGPITDQTDYSANVLTENNLDYDDLLTIEDDVLDKTAKDDFDLYGESLNDISDEDIAANKESEQANVDEVLSVSDTGEVEANSDEAEDNSNHSTPGEAVLASSTTTAGYFASAKLAREQNRAKEKESLMEMIENEELSEEVKQEATKNMLALNTVMEKENATEILLEAKGFDGAVVSILDNSVDVVINAPTITEQQIAQIESIVKRKTGVASDNIVISPVVVEE